MRRFLLSLRASVLPALALAGVWLLLLRSPTWPGWDAWLLGALALALALWAGRRARCASADSAAAATSPGLRWRALVPLLGVFGWQSLRGALDVSWRVLQPKMPLLPGLLQVALQSADERQHIWLVLLVSLMPGTLAVRLDGRCLTLHALDTRLNVAAEVARFEALIAALYAPAAANA